MPILWGRVMPDEIEPGDHVHHHPTGEDWVVRYVKGDRLSWLGWPPGEAMLADCTLIRKADDEACLTATPPAQPADSITPSNKE